MEKSDNKVDLFNEETQDPPRVLKEMTKDVVINHSYRTFCSYRSRVYKGRRFTQKSMTVPDEALTMREILDKHTRGQHIDGSMTSIYEDEGSPTNGINPKTLDLQDIREMQLDTQKSVEKLQADLMNAASKRKQAAIQKQIDAAVEAERKKGGKDASVVADS